MTDRTKFTASDTISHLWDHLDLPHQALQSLQLPDTNSDPGLPSSFKVGHLAQSTIALSALAASLFHATRNGKSSPPPVQVALRHACAEFKSERLYRIDGHPPPDPWGPIGGLHATRDGYVRIHDNWMHHRQAALDILRLPSNASRAQVAEALKSRSAVEVETAAFQSGGVIAALRSYEQWDAHPQASAISDFPIQIRRLASDGPKGLSPWLKPANDRCLRGVRVLDLSRVIAGPVAGRALASHGADVLWVTGPGLPDLPPLDRDLSRGKRTIQLDLNSAAGKAKLLDLVRDADVFIQNYRPGSLTAKGLGPSDLAGVNPRIIYAELCAYGSNGPWSQNRGFDSLVQTCSGMNVSEAEHFGAGEAARVMPCQALDHGAGFCLASGVMAALYHRTVAGSAWKVEVSLAGVMKYLRSLGQHPGNSGFQCEDISFGDDDLAEYLDSRASAFGEITALKPAARVEGAMPGWDIMSKPLGSDVPEWMS
ncbi:uncharacterized protein PFLUO_LOCUS3128 [Penicillium psychrofluorescens]|uniref:uncharacterized protein n=1 Tax=Penicillium psychrofluorescens TaxID=3158075 RepID=UPI003CCD004D